MIPKKYGSGLKRFTTILQIFNFNKQSKERKNASISMRFLCLTSCDYALIYL